MKRRLSCLVAWARWFVPGPLRHKRSTCSAVSGIARQPQRAPRARAGRQVYGTSFAGGDFGFGTIFRVAPGGGAEVLHSFNGQTGKRPGAGLVLATDGPVLRNYRAWRRLGSGRCIRVDTDGVVDVLHEFDEFGVTGTNPKTALFEASDLWLYGTSERTAFRIDPTSDVFELLHTFTNAEARVPSALPCREATGFSMARAAWAARPVEGHLQDGRRGEPDGPARLHVLRHRQPVR